MQVITAKNNKDELFLNINGQFTSDYDSILKIETEIISDNNEIYFFRIKAHNQYITINDENNIYLSDIKNDNNIFYKNRFDENLNFLCQKRHLSNKNSTLSSEENISYRFFDPLKYYVKIRLLNEIEMFFKDGIIVLDFNLKSLMYEDFQKAKEIVNNSNHKRMGDILKINPCFQRLLTHSKIKNFINKIYTDKKYHLTTFSSNKVNKSFTESSWHIDYPYHNLGTNIPKETLGLQLLILLDDFKTNNGGTQYIEGSHKYRKFPFSDDISTHSDQVKTLVAKEGSVVIWLGKLWHKEGISQVDEYRSALLANFSPLEIPAKDDMKSLLTFENLGLELDSNDKLRFI
jgi:hypothetical protein